MSRRRCSHLLCLGLSLAFTICGGCSSEVRPQITAGSLQHVNVSGVVRVNGQPASKVFVTFHPEEIGLNFVSAETDSEGRYSLGKSEAAGREIYPGPYRVVVSDDRPTTPDDAGAGEPGSAKTSTTRKAGAKVSRIPAKYGNSEGSPLRTMVKPGQDHQFDIDILADSANAP